MQSREQAGQGRDRYKGGALTNLISMKTFISNTYLYSIRNCFSFDERNLNLVGSNYFQNCTCGGTMKLNLISIFALYICSSVNNSFLG